MLSFAYMLRWPIWTTPWLYVSNIVRSILRTLYGRFNGPAAPVLSEDVKQCISTEGELSETPLQSPTNHSIPLNNMADVIHYGSTATLSRVRPGVLLKLPYEPNIEAPHVEKIKESVVHAFSVEQPILEMLGSHPRIVQYLGRENQGILLGEASHGNLQAYLDNNNSSMALCLRKKWCKQASEATDYIHSRGVIHADMRPENFLIHESNSGSLDLLLCDFGGAKCEKLQLDGNHLPDGPFYDPTQGTERSPALDIFSLGSLFYTIMTGSWPYRSSSGPFSSVEEMLEYTTKVNELFLQGQYPSVDGLAGGNVIMGCWLKKYKTMGELLLALDGEL